MSDVAVEEINLRVGWMTTDTITAGKSPTVFVTAPGNEDAAGDDNARSYFFFMPRLPENTTLLPGGRMPKEELLNAPDDPPELEAIIPQEAATLFGVGVGDRLSAVPPWLDVVRQVNVVISGVYVRDAPGADIWYLERDLLNAATGPSFRTVPFYVSEKTFFEVLGPEFRRLEAIFAWHLRLDTGRVNARNADLALFHIEEMHSTLASALPGYRQTTALDRDLREYERRLFFNKLPMFVVLILIAVVILYYVATLSSLVVEDRRAEIALLRSRGASSAQILMVFVMEGTTIAVLAVAAGPLLASASISVLGLTPAFSELTGGSSLDVAISGGAYAMSAVGGILSFVALIVPAVQASRIGVTRHRQEASRPASQPAFQRYYVDILLLLLAIFLFRQLTEQGSVVAVRLFGDAAVNQLLLALPGLILVASAMVLLRLFPLAMNLASRTLSSRLPAGLVMGMWQMARNPTHYARLSLLLILTAGLGIFASSFGATLELSFEQRVLHSTGSDVRLEGVRPQFRIRQGFSGPTGRRGTARTAQPALARRPSMIEAYEEVPGVDRAAPVLKSSGHDLTKAFGDSYVMIAMNSETFNGVGPFFRDDFADRPMDELLESLRLTDLPQGIELPSNARTIGVRLRADRPQPSIRVTARIKDANDRYSTYFLGTLRSSDWSVLESSLMIGSSRLRQPDLPLTLVSLRVHEVGGSGEVARRLQAGSVLIDDIWAVGGNGVTEIIESFDDTSKWSVLRATPEASADVLRKAENGGSGAALFSWTRGNALSARGIFHGSLPTLPVLASRSFVKVTGHSPGEEFDVSVAGFRIPVRLQDTVKMFPTVTSFDQRFLVTDLTSLSRYANLSAIDRELLPNTVWLSTSDDGPGHAETIGALENIDTYTSTSVHDRAKLMGRSQVDPLVQAGWRALLFIAFGAVLILSCLGFLVHAYVSFRNRQLQFALLRTVGFSIRQLSVMVWLEQMLVIAVGMALGTWMGGRLGAIIMPFLGHDDWGDEVIPPFVMQVNWGALLITYAFMILVFAVITMALIWLVTRISLHRTLRLGEM